MKYEETLIIPSSVVQSVFDMENGLGVVEEAFRQHGLGKARMPSKIYLDIPEYSGDFRAMPAFIPDLKAAGLKWVNSHPGNTDRGYPTVMAVLILNDPETAWPLAIMDATYITMIRTGAGGGVAAKYMARNDSEVVALIACGIQAESQLDALQRVFNFKKVALYDPDPDAVKTLTSLFKDANYSFEIKSSVEECVKDADIVVTTTPSRKPVVMKGWLKDGAHINAIGADAAGKQELDPEILKRGKVIVDDFAQATHSGEVNVPLSNQVMRREDIYSSIGEVIAGLKKGRENDQEITIFDSTGLAIQDMGSARFVYEKCLEKGLGTKVKLM